MGTFASPSPVTSHQSRVTSHQSPVTSHQSPVTSHESLVTSHELTYPLPDSVLIDPEATGTAIMIWQPEESCIVMGSSNRAETAIHEECARADGWPVYKRPSGGQSVILTPSTLVISIRFFSGTQDNPRTYFRKINRLIISALEGLGITGLSEKGISDIALRDKKILGSSIYRKKTLVFYHAVLNVAESPERISRYLKHPSREPDYRAGRKHEEFVTSLRMSGYNQEMDEIRKALSGSLTRNL